jgi:hypothetical protein
MVDSEISWLITIIAVLSLFSFVCTTYSHDMAALNVGQWYGPHNYTIKQTFTDNLTSAQVNLKNVWGTWDINNTDGLHPTGFIDRAWNPFEDQYLARAQFGNVRLINNTFSEKYYLNNINRDASDYTAILVSSQGTMITTGANEILLVIEGDRVYLESDTLEFGYLLPGGRTIYDKGFQIPAGVTSGNISYKAEFANGGVTDPMTGGLGSNVNNFFNFYVYWEDQLAFSYGYNELMQTAASNLQRQADIRTNIGQPGEAYRLQVLSHFEDVHVVQISTEIGADLTGYDEALGWVTTLIGVLTWGLTVNVGIPTEILFLFIGLPEFALGYILVRLLRGGG